MGTTTYTYDFTGAGFGNGTLDITVTASTSLTQITGLSTGTFGYGISQITGEFGGSPITGQLGTGGARQFNSGLGQSFDNTVFPSDTAGALGASSYGIDDLGAAFDSGPIDVNIYYVTTSNAWTVTYGTGNNSITNAMTLVSSDAPCYCSGSRILTDGGEIAVERLVAGDRVVTASGERRLIKWIGQRSYAGRFLAANPKVQPIRFRAGSLGSGLPRRDLLVSPDHAMFLDGLLIPAQCLVNGSTIVQDRGLDRVDYFHIELDSHDVILAEGAQSETFVDDGSRHMFHNAHECSLGFAAAAEFCAPRVESGYELEAVRRRLDALAGETALAA